MFLIYKPGDGEEQEWWFDPQDMRVKEAEAVEKRTGWDWTEYFIHLLAGSVLARRALLWTFQRRIHPTLRFEDVDFAMSELTLEYDQAELQRLRDKTAEQDGVTAEQLAQLDEQVTQARPGLGKAPASSGG
ncbi:MAG TPA: hypothetical protein VFG87_28050 [Amycolatopsis sp.]|nr:hypothetical protein [Amycolatopsis sp.]